MVAAKTVRLRIPVENAWRDKNRVPKNSSDKPGLLQKSLVAEFQRRRPRTMKTVSRIIPAAIASRAKKRELRFSTADQDQQ
jgi:hypothetical protein